METFPNLDPNNLVILYYVATEKSLTSAAAKLHLTQPAITYHIKSLEEYTRVKLLDIKKHQVSLTPTGEEVFKYAEEIYRQLINAEAFIKSIRESNLSVGIASLFTTTVSPILEAMFEKREPEVKLTVKSGNAGEMVQDVVESKLDLAIVPHFNYDIGKLNHITVSPPLKLVCFMSGNQPHFKEPLSWEQLSELPLVSGPETSAIRRIIFDKFEKEGLVVKPLAAEVGNIEWCKTLVENGKGISFILANDIERQIGEGRLKVVQLKEDILITADAVTRSDSFVNPVIKKFISMVKLAFGYTGIQSVAIEEISLNKTEFTRDKN